MIVCSCNVLSDAQILSAVANATDPSPPAVSQTRLRSALQGLRPNHQEHPRRVLSPSSSEIPANEMQTSLHSRRPALP